MGFLKDVKRDARARGVWLDPEQARTLLALACRAALPLAPEEEDILRRFKQRVRELK